MPSLPSMACFRSTRQFHATPTVPQPATLTFMAGGAQAAFDVAEPKLKPIAGRIVHRCDAGAIRAVKICNKMILGISMICVAEAFVLAEKLGLSYQELLNIASTSSDQCWTLTSYYPIAGPVPDSPPNRDYQPSFAAALMLKDLKLSQEVSQQACSPLSEPKQSSSMRSIRPLVTATRTSPVSSSSCVARQPD